MKGIVIQMGSFNPIHRMHLKIADNAIQAYPEYQHTFCMAIQTCDKGENSTEEIDRRAALIQSKGKYLVSKVKSGLFVDVIREIRNEEPEAEIVFPVGEDTMYRFFRDWDAYYADKAYDFKLLEYQKAFCNVTWYVSKRKCAESETYAAITKQYLDFHRNIVWSDLDLDDISSTKIRAGEVENI